MYIKDITTILQIAKNNNGLLLQDIDRFDDRFDDDYKLDNSYNWSNMYVYSMEIRQKDNLTFCFIPNNENGDIRGLSYDDNCVLFTEIEDFYDFVDSISETTDDEDEE